MQSIKIIQITGKPIILPEDNIDTDRIIPARFLKSVTFNELGEHVFEDDRNKARLENKAHPFEDQQNKSASILITGQNFGSGSSREHAVHALMKWKGGIQAVISKGKYSEIFFNNALNNGLPCLIVKEKDWHNLIGICQKNLQTEISINLEKMTVKINSKFMPAQFQQKTAQKAFVCGKWNKLAELLAGREKIEYQLALLPYLS